jgi:ABC-type oligopeptide transport system ATPase subunit
MINFQKIKNLKKSNRKKKAMRKLMTRFLQFSHLLFKESLMLMIFNLKNLLFLLKIMVNKLKVIKVKKILISKGYPLDRSMYHQRNQLRGAQKQIKGGNNKIL